MRVTPAHLTERQGLALVERIVVKEFGWLFRDQPISDLGVDAHVETVFDNRSSGRLLALQIKSGESYFREQRDGRVVFRDDQSHFRYWLNHSLPVLVVVCRPETDEAYWEHVTEETVTSTPFGATLFVPLSNRFAFDARERIAALAGSAAATPKGSEEVAAPFLAAVVEAAELGEWAGDVGGVSLQCRRIAESPLVRGVLVGAEGRDPAVWVLRSDRGQWRPVDELPVRTRGSDTIPAEFIDGGTGQVLVLRAPEMWGTGVFLETERWIWIKDKATEVLRYPTYAHVSGWGESFDRFLSAREVSRPSSLSDGTRLEVLFEVRYTPSEGDPGGDEVLDRSRTMRLRWREDVCEFAPMDDSEISPSEAVSVFDEPTESFVSTNVEFLEQLARSGQGWAREWIAVLAEESDPKDRARLMQSIEAEG